MKEFDPKQFGKLLAALIKLRDVKRKELAKYVGVHPNVVNYWCVGARTPSLPNYISICNYLSVSAEYFFSDEPSKQTAVFEDVMSMVNAITNCMNYYIEKVRKSN